MRLYAITDRSWLNGRPFVPEVERVLAAGATFLQLREKELDQASFLAEAKELKALAARYRVPFVVNDSVEIAVQIGADGVHVGQSDIRGRDLRSLLGPEKILGVSANTVETAVRAEESGADYIGVGAVFGTTTKRMLRTSRCSSCWKSAAPFRFQSSPSAESAPRTSESSRAAASTGCRSSRRFLLRPIPPLRPGSCAPFRRSCSEGRPDEQALCHL